MKQLDIFLIPGFFGFANIGSLRYFAHVREYLEDTLRRRGRRARVHHVSTLPTSSLPDRASKLAEDMRRMAPRGDVHLIGHSSGGLDARLLLSPGIPQFVTGTDGAIERVRSVLTVSTPHRGTPLAALFGGLVGQKLLKLFSLTTMHTIRLGTVPLPALMALARAFTPGGHVPLLRGGLLDQVYGSILRDFSDERRGDIVDFFDRIEDDQALVPQISPEAMDLFGATVRRRPGVRYGCVVTRARPPGLRAMASVGLRPVNQAMYALYRALYRVVKQMPPGRLPDLDDPQRLALTSAYGDVPDETCNDAIVPTLSQVFGEVVHAAWADHLDTIGHFADPGYDPPHVEWLLTRCDFGRRGFQALWDDVVDFALGAG